MVAGFEEFEWQFESDKHCCGQTSPSATLTSSIPASSSLASSSIPTMATQYIPRGLSVMRDLGWPNTTKDLDRLMETRERHRERARERECERDREQYGDRDRERDRERTRRELSENQLQVKAHPLNEILAMQSGYQASSGPMLLPSRDPHPDFLSSLSLSSGFHVLGPRRCCCLRSSTTQRSLTPQILETRI